MLETLTPNKKGLRKIYNSCGGKKALGVSFKDLWGAYFSEIDGFGPGYYLDTDPSTPKSLPMYAYNEFTREVTLKDSLECLDRYKLPYGIADNKEQIDEYFKKEIADPETKYVIFLSKINYVKGEEDYRPYKSGNYLGKYEQIRNCEYYGDCEFPDDYQGYLLKFELVKVV